MSIQRPITKKSYVTCKKALNALCEKRMQSSMFKCPSFYYFLEFHCKILNCHAIYRCKRMVKILNCYLYAKKVMALCLKVQFYLANPVMRRLIQTNSNGGVGAKYILNEMILISEQSLYDSKINFAEAA